MELLPSLSLLLLLLRLAPAHADSGSSRPQLLRHCMRYMPLPLLVLPVLSSSVLLAAPAVRTVRLPAVHDPATAQVPAAGALSEAISVGHAAVLHALEEAGMFVTGHASNGTV